MDFVNINRVKARAGQEVTADKYFKLRIPSEPNKIQNIVDGNFVQILHFSENQKIITLYIPHKGDSEILNHLDMNYRKFSAMCEEKGLRKLIDDKLLHPYKRRFAIVKPDQSDFFILYLNIEQKNVAKFNYAINSIHF